MRRLLQGWCALLVGGVVLGMLPVSSPGQAPAESKPQSAAPPDLSTFRTLDLAVTSRISLTRPTEPRSPGYLGIHVKSEGGSLTLTEVQKSSPADQAGLRPG